VSIERIRRDRVLHERGPRGRSWLHRALVFGPVPHHSSKYTRIACGLLDGQPAEAAEAQR
jgi:hypothetical protein